MCAHCTPTDRERERERKKEVLSMSFLWQKSVTSMKKGGEGRRKYGKCRTIFFFEVRNLHAASPSSPISLGNNNNDDLRWWWWWWWCRVKVGQHTFARTVIPKKS